MAGEIHGELLIANAEEPFVEDVTARQMLETLNNLNALDSSPYSQGLPARSKF